MMRGLKYVYIHMYGYAYIYYEFLCLYNHIFWGFSFFFLDRVYLGSPDYPETSCAEQAGPSLRDSPASASGVLPLKYAPAGLSTYIHSSNAN